MATLQGKAVKNTYRQVLQIGANNVGVSGSAQRVQDGAGVNTALSLSTVAATVHGDLTITGDLIITGGGLQIQDLIDDTVATLIQNGTGITWTYNDGARTLTGNFTGTTSVVPEGSNLYYTQGRFDSAFAAKSTTNLAEGTNLYFTNTRVRTALSVTAGTGISYDNTTGVFNLAAIPNVSLTNSSITINSQSVALGGSVTLTTTNIAEGTNLYYTQARFDTAFSNKTTTDLAEGTNLYYTQARFNSALAAKTTTDLAEGTNLYYTDARARLALSSSATGLSYANNSGVFSLTAGYAIPTTVKLGQYDTAYNRSIVSAAVTGTGTKTLSLTQQDANVVTATWTDLGITTINGTANQIATTTVGNTTTVAFTNDVTMPNNLIVSGNLTINGTATYVNTQSISAKDPLFEVANDNNTTDAVDIGYYGRYYDTPQTRVEFTGLFRDASDAGKFKFFTGLVDEPTNVVNTTGTGYTVGTLVANFEGNLAGTANAANQLSTARTIAASGDATWSVSFDGSANVSSALTLANTGVTATTYGTSTAVPTIAVDSKGRITSASNTNITFPVTTVNGFAGTVVLTTSDVAEGSNQYFTTARAQAAISGTAPISVTSGVVSISQAGGATNGYLSSTDWNTFNNKLSTATAASTYVPYTGATGAVNLGAYDLAVQGLTIGKGLNSLSNNSALGYQALFHTTTGNFNTAVGYQSGHNTTTATYNTSIGQSSLFANTTGGLNTAIGVNALLNTTTGTSNVALGLDSLQHNTSGSSNTALGYNAGSHITGGTTPNTTASNSVYIGRDTRANIDGGTNEIVIGSAVTGSGSNTVTIGNSSITANYFKGSINGGSFVKIGGTSSQFLKADGSVDSSTYLTTSSASSTYVPYTGATSSVNLGANGLTANGLAATNGNNGVLTLGSATFFTTIQHDATTTGATIYTTAAASGGGHIFKIGTTTPLTIASGGAATFSNNILSTNPTSNTINLTVDTGYNFKGFNGYWGFRTGTAFDFNLDTYNANTQINVLKILQTGAATFSSSVTTSGNFITTGSGYFVTATSLAMQLNGSVANDFQLNGGGPFRVVNQAYNEVLLNITNAGIASFRSTATSSVGFINTNTTSSAASIYSELGVNTNNTSSTHFVGAQSGFGNRINIFGNGNITNSNNSYGGISDIKVKENITDATDKLEKLLKVRIVNYNLIGDEQKQLGVIAQELEKIFPSMIDETEDFEQVEVTDENGNVTKEKQSLGTVTKSVKYSVFVPMLIKAIQELEARVKELEGK